MNELEGNAAVTVTIGIATAASLWTLWRLFLRHIDGRPLVPYEPRRPVPWNGWPALILLSPLLLGLIASVAGWDQPEAESPAGVSGMFVWAAALNAAVMLAITAAAYAALASLTGATRRDLGLPADARQFVSDVRLGAIAFLAALTPTYFVMFALNWVFQPEDGHPFVEQFTESPSWSVMISIAVAAVIGAPVYEETAFRLVLQGWLEKWGRKRQSAPPLPVFPLDEPGSAEPMPLEVARLEPMEAGGGDDDGAVAVADAAGSPAGDDAVGGVANIGGEGATDVDAPAAAPGGWGAIAVSAVVFGLAHWGHGAAPGALIVLGVVLGYLYQRTGRIVPAMTCHLLFNAFTMWQLLLVLLDSKVTQ